jgi:hypothetical protein
MHTLPKMPSQPVTQPTWLYWSDLSFSFMLGCLLLFSSCRSISITSQQASSLAHQEHNALISSTLKQQGQQELQTLHQWISVMQQYKVEAGQYQQAYNTSASVLAAAKTVSAYEKSLQKLNQQIQAARLSALQHQATNLSKQLLQGAQSWGETHTYNDPYNGTNYPLGYEYGPNGVGGWTNDDLTNAKTITDYQQVIEEGNTSLTNFLAYKTNTSDPTPWDQTHKTDQDLMKHYYGYSNGKTVVVSLSEQAMRIYNNGKLVNSMQVTTGRPTKPSPPGVWWIENKQSPTVFKSSEPKGSLYWYPDTPITYAMLYHSGGYFIHESWWRSDYGPNTQFPHADASGDSYSFDGSHGCINITKDNARWLYDFVNVGTHVIVY